MKMLVALLALASLALADDVTEEQKKKAEAEARKPGAVEMPDPGTPVEDSAVARQRLARFHKAWKEAKKEPEACIEALKKVGEWDHPAIFKAVVKHISHKDHTVAVAAIQASARQSKSFKKVASKFMRALKKEKRTNLVCGLLVGLGKIGYAKRDAIDVARKNFKRDTGERHKAATRYFGYIKYKPAFRWLAEKLDAPQPGSVNSRTNPPASYWKARWHEWESNVAFTRWAISQLIEGETFDTKDEAKQWAESEGAKHGVKW